MPSTSEGADREPESPGEGSTLRAWLDSPWSGRALAAMAFTVCAGLLLGPILSSPATNVLGAYDSEAGWHIWRFAAYLRQLPEQGPFVYAPEPMTRNPSLANLFPGTTLLAWPFFWAGGRGLSGVTLAWNACYAMALVGLSLGTWACVRAWLPEDPRRLAAATATVIAASSAYLQGMPDVGRLETLHQFLYPVHLAFLMWATLRRPTLWATTGAVVTMGLMAMQGGFPAMFVGLVEPLAAAWCLKESPRRLPAAGVIALTAIAGLLGLWPWIAAHQLHPSPAMLGREGEIVVALEQLLPGGAEVGFTRGYHVTPYLGVIAPLVGLVSAVAAPRSRPWLLLAALCGVVMLGPELAFTRGGEALASLPSRWIAESTGLPIPQTGWSRMGTFATFMLAMSTAPLALRLPKASVALALLACVDQLCFLPAWSHEEASWRLSPSASLRAALDDGPAVLTPQDDQALTWLHALDDPSNRRWPMGDVDGLRTLRWVEQVAPPQVERFRGLGRKEKSLPPPHPNCVLLDGQRLRDAGFTWLIYRGPRQTSEVNLQVLTVLERGLGDAVYHDAAMGAWDLRLLPEGRVICDETHERPMPRGAPKRAPER